MKKTILLLALLMSATLMNKMFGQTTRCFTDELHHQLLSTDETYKLNREAIAAHTAKYVASPTKSRAIKTIPVVFHIVYNTPQQNVSDQQILSQLAILNQDFRKLNSDWNLTPSVFLNSVADCEIQFCLAQQDPNGNPTTGILRIPTAVTGFTTDNAVKFTNSGGSNAWDRTKYLNIWVCKFSVGVLGYAQFPGGPAATDGVVCNFISFGNTGTALQPYNKGRTLTHEIGHWLNLSHIWGDDGTGCNGSDGVEDTPNQAGSNSACVSFPKISCNNGPNGDMFMNFMDYTPDNCMYMFTTGQKLIMEAQFANGGFRSSLLNSPGCNLAINTNCEAPNNLNLGAISHQSADLLWTPSAFSLGYNVEFKMLTDSSWTSITTNGLNITLNGLLPGITYQARVRSTCNGSNSNYSPMVQFTTLSAPCTAPTNLQATTIGVNSCTIAWNPVAVGSSYTIQYKSNDDSLWTTLSAINGNSQVLNNLVSASTYTVRMSTLCGNVMSDYSSAISFTTSTPPCSNSFESNDVRANAKPITPFTSIASMLQTTTDKDYYVFTTSNAAPKISVIMNNLPADYDIRLIGSNGISVLGTSAKRGLSTEVINYNAATIGSTYYLYVFGYNGAWSNQSCYNITVRTSANLFREIAPDFIEENEPFTLFPNPAESNLSVSYNAEATSISTWRIYSITGQLLKEIRNEAAESGNNQLAIDISDLKTGVYLLVTDLNNNIQRKRFNVLK